MAHNSYYISYIDPELGETKESRSNGYPAVFDFEPLDDAAMPLVINVIAAMTIFNESTKNC